MYTHLLVPTDGSPLSEAAIRNAIGLAKEMNARITLLRVIPDYHILTYQAEMLEDTREKYAEEAREQVEQYLSGLKGQALAAGVPCETAYAVNDHPYEAIVSMAQTRHCDLIVMASHGRRGLQGLLLGSETMKVLTHSKMPVLVYR